MTIGARRWISLAALGAALCLLPCAARAQMPTVGDTTGPRGRYRSPQHFAFQLSFGPYRPDVDSEFDRAATPYNDYFGDGRHLLTQVEFDYQLFHKVGSLAIGLGVGFFQRLGTGAAGHTAPGAPSGDKSTLTVVPVSLSAVYRFDYYLVTRDFPLVPYAKLGLDWAYWQITDGNGEIAHDGAGGRGRGGDARLARARSGWRWCSTCSTPTRRATFDAEMGVNHTALMFEYGHYDISGLGASDRLHVGDTTWTLGLLFEF